MRYAITHLLIKRKYDLNWYDTKFDALKVAYEDTEGDTFLEWYSTVKDDPAMVSMDFYRYHMVDEFGNIYWVEPDE